MGEFDSKEPKLSCYLEPNCHQVRPRCQLLSLVHVCFEWSLSSHISEGVKKAVQLEVNKEIPWKSVGRRTDFP